MMQAIKQDFDYPNCGPKGWWVSLVSKSVDRLTRLGEERYRIWEGPFDQPTIIQGDLYSLKSGAKSKPKSERMQPKVEELGTKQRLWPRLTNTPTQPEAHTAKRKRDPILARFFGVGENTIVDEYWDRALISTLLEPAATLVKVTYG